MSAQQATALRATSSAAAAKQRAAAPRAAAPRARGCLARHVPAAAAPTRLRAPRRAGTLSRAAAAEGASAPQPRLVPFPQSYAEMTEQVQSALQAALDDGVPLMEIQFPPAGLDTVPGDAEGNVESNLVVAFMRDFCRVWQRRGALARLRVFFPDKVELGLAVGGAGRSSDGIPAPDNTFTPGPFAQFPGRCTWLCQPGVLTTSGLGRALGLLQPAVERTAPDDVAFCIAYPSLNLDEMSEVAALHAARPDVPIVTVNAELERIRSGYYPYFWAKQEMDVLRAFAPRFNPIYFLHNFKGSAPAVLFRAYPGPFQVLLRGTDSAGSRTFRLVHTCDTFPGLRAVAADIIPKALAEARKARG